MAQADTSVGRRANEPGTASADLDAVVAGLRSEITTADLPEAGPAVKRHARAWPPVYAPPGRITDPLLPGRLAGEPTQ